MDYFKCTTEDMSQLARLALRGKQKDVQVFVRRLAKRYQEAAPALSEDLASLCDRCNRPQSRHRSSEGAQLSRACPLTWTLG